MSEELSSMTMMAVFPHTNPDLKLPETIACAIPARLDVRHGQVKSHKRHSITLSKMSNATFQVKKVNISVSDRQASACLTV